MESMDHSGHWRKAQQATTSQAMRYQRTRCLVASKITNANTVAMQIRGKANAAWTPQDRPLIERVPGIGFRANDVRASHANNGPDIRPRTAASMMSITERAKNLYPKRPSSKTSRRLSEMARSEMRGIGSEKTREPRWRKAQNHVRSTRRRIV
jgi:hypothetical protein